MKKLLAAERVGFATRYSKRCCLCKLSGGKAEALKLICESREKTNRPTLEGAVELLEQIGVRTNDRSFRNHYLRHRHGQKNSKTNR